MNRKFLLWVRKAAIFLALNAKRTEEPMAQVELMDHGLKKQVLYGHCLIDLDSPTHPRNHPNLWTVFSLHFDFLFCQV